MPGDEGTTATNTASTASVGSAQMQQSSLPSGIPMPKPLNLDNVAANWKKFKRAWDNYAVVVRLQRFDEEDKNATFLSAIGEEALEIYEGMTFNPPESSKAGAGDTMKDAVADHDVKIRKLLGRCQERNIKLNKQKVAFKQTEVPYIGHLLTLRGSKGRPIQD